MSANEVTATNSHAVLITEIAELRRQCWQVITAAKVVAPLVPITDQAALLEVLIEAERHLK